MDLFRGSWALMPHLSKGDYGSYFAFTDNPRYIDTHQDMSFVSLYRISQYIETEFHSIILPPEKKSNSKLSI